MKWSPSEINALTNDKFAFWYSQGCHPGQFEAADECIAEAWTVYDHGGYGAIMNTGYGYGAWSSTDGPDNRFSREFWDALFYPPEEIYQISIANQDSTWDNMWHINDGNCMYHDAYQNTYFGDPYLEMKGAEDFSADFHWDLDYPNPDEYIHFYEDCVGADSYHWNFGDGTTSNQANPTKSYTSQGEFDVTLTIYGDGETDSVTKTIEIWDNWRPEAIATPEMYAGNNPTINFDGSLSWDPDGTVVGYLWDFDDGSTSSQMNPSHTYSQDGIYDVTLTVTDDGGKQSYPAHCEIRIDAYTPPETEAIIQGSYGNNGWIKSPVTIILSATDWSGVDYTRYSADGGSWSTYTEGVHVYTNGQHTVSYYSVDIWGNTEDIKTSEFKIDGDKPELDVTIEGEEVNGYYASDVTVTCSASDDVSGLKWIQYNIIDEMEEWETYTVPFVISGDGSYIVRIYSEDNAGNSRGKATPWLVEIDISPPVTTCNIIGNQQTGGWYDGEISIEFDATDTAGVEETYYKFDNTGDWQSYDMSGTITYSERGTHTVNYYSTDVLGNEETPKTDTFTIGAPPDTPTIQGPATGTPDTEYTFTISATHPEGSTLEYYVDWGDDTYEDWFGPYSSGEDVEISHTWSEKKQYTIRVKARDQWGGESDWGTITFSTPKAKSTLYLLIQDFIQRLIDRFPILERLFNLPIFDKLLS
jgi:PKD repeat protein